MCEFNENKIKECIFLLKNNKDLSKNDLLEDLSVDESFTYICDISHAYYGKKEYKQLVDIVDSYFSEIDNIIPNSIGSFLYGHKVSHNLDIESCYTLLGACSMFKTDRKYTVMLATFDHKLNGYNFLDLNDSKNREETYIYVEDNFKGFSEYEKKSLKEYGINKIIIYSFQNGCKKYKSIISKFTNIDDL